MNRVKLSLILLIVLGTIGIAKAQTEDISQFQWIIGNWKGNHNGGIFLENWAQIDENTLEGQGYNVVKSDTLFREKLHIQKIGDFWVYIATIEENYPILFTLINSDNDTWNFVNYEHDFPQRIVYTKNENGQLHVKIQGETEGVQMKEEYLLEKY
ncbi:MAG: DUF6265 family protein [Bacteroidales bacterium]